LILVSGCPILGTPPGMALSGRRGASFVLEQGNSNHRRPVIRFSDAPRGTCRWCGETIFYAPGPKQGTVDFRRRWHPECVAEYESTDPRELRRAIRKRDRGVCRDCGLDTDSLRRKIRGRGRAKRLRELGFHPRRSLWELDHVVPLIEGGGHEAVNLQTLCVPCHRQKSASEARARGARRAEDRDAAAAPQAESSLDELIARADAANSRVEALLRGD
jgi:5-methylcytosine-specific restriction endonuclease McrA